MLRRTFLVFAFGLLVSGGLNIVAQKPADASLQAKDFWLQKTYPEARFDGVLVGDSRLYRGLSPAAMAPALPGLRLHNFGYSSARLTPAFLDAAENLLDADQPRRCVVLGLTAHSLSQPKLGQAANPHYQGLAKTPAHEAWLRHRGNVLASHWFPSLINDPTKALQLAAQGATKLSYSEHFHASGLVASDTVPRDPNRALASYRKTLASHPASNQALEALVAWVRGARKRGLSVFVFEPPRPRAMEQLEQDLGRLDPDHCRTVLQAAGAAWLDVPTQGMHSYDGSHLDAASAKVLSLALAQGIAAALKLPQDKRESR